MSQRINKADLEQLVDRINTVKGTPMLPRENGKSNVDNYHLSWAYGGVKLEQMVNECGGVRCITSGYGTKKELYYQLQAMLSIL